MPRIDDELEAQRRRMDNLLSDLRPLIPFFEDSACTDVYIYSDGRVQVKYFDKGIIDADFAMPIPERLRIINSLASVQDVPIDKWARPTLESIIPKYNIRTTAILPPWVEFPEITFRRPAEKIYTMEEYVDAGRMSKELYEKVLSHIENRSNIIIAGSTGSGKTTFTNAALEKMRELTPDDRFYIVEDTFELQCRAKNVTHLVIRKEQSVLAIQTALRWTPNRIIFGELRSGDVALELLEAWNTGHPGNITTIHADSARSTLPRIYGLLRQKISGSPPDLKDTIHLIVHLANKYGIGPFVDEALTLEEIERTSP